MTTELTSDQQKLYEIFELARRAPPELGHTPRKATDALLTSKKSPTDLKIVGNSG